MKMLSPSLQLQRVKWKRGKVLKMEFEGAEDETINLTIFSSVREDTASAFLNVFHLHWKALHPRHA